MASPSTRVSVLSSSTSGSRAARRPVLTPPAKPRLRGLRSTRTSGYAASTASALPSAEALSTTITSPAAPRSGRKLASASSSNVRVFHETITIETRGRLEGASDTVPFPRRPGRGS
jgi:hypothetical protein